MRKLSFIRWIEETSIQLSFRSWKTLMTELLDIQMRCFVAVFVAAIRYFDLQINIICAPHFDT
jgi:hypothetical protein